MRLTSSLVFTALFLNACGEGCTLIGCSPGVTLKFPSPFVEAGEYTFTLTSNTDAVTCVAFIPLRRDGTEPPCEPMSINREEITMRTSGGIHGTAGNGIVSVWLSGEHDAVSIQVTHDGTEVLRADVTPAYRGVEINGEGCGECPMATHTVGG